MADEYIKREDAIVAAWEGSDEWDGGCNRHRDKCIEMHIKAIPAADVAPVRHGRWTAENRCSACGEEPLTDFDVTLMRFCPYCGAKMDGGDE